MTTSPSSITSRSEDKNGWEFADFAECLSWHDKNSTFQGSICLSQCGQKSPLQGTVDKRYTSLCKENTSNDFLTRGYKTGR